MSYTSSVLTLNWFTPPNFAISTKTYWIERIRGSSSKPPRQKLRRFLKLCALPPPSNFLNIYVNLMNPKSPTNHTLITTTQEGETPPDCRSQITQPQCSAALLWNQISRNRSCDIAENWSSGRQKPARQKLRQNIKVFQNSVWASYIRLLPQNPSWNSNIFVNRTNSESHYQRSNHITIMTPRE